MAHSTVKLAAPLLTASCLAAQTRLGSEDARTAANDDAAAGAPSAERNPLWIIVIGMACFFAVTAAVITLN
jgi:hypothetical protein